MIYREGEGRGTEVYFSRITHRLRSSWCYSDTPGGGGYGAHSRLKKHTLATDLEENSWR